MVSNYLQELSGEVLHLVFDYLKPHEIFQSFIDVDPDINPLVFSYDRLDINFESIDSSRFQLIIDYLKPEQIRLMRLSDHWSLNNRLDEILLRFHLSSMIRLTHLELIDIQESNLIALIFDHLNSHRLLEKLVFTKSRSEINKRVSREICDNLSSFVSLKDLQFTNMTPLTYFRRPLSTLSRLKLDNCSIDDFGKIFLSFPQLLSLDLSSTEYGIVRDLPKIPLGLEELRINANFWMSFTNLENMFTSDSSLQIFVIKVSGDIRFLNAGAWKQLIETKLNRLKEFQIKIEPDENHLKAEDVLQPFENLFWQKLNVQMAVRVSVELELCIGLFSIPYFCPDEDWFPTYIYHPLIAVQKFPFRKYVKSVRVYASPQSDEPATKLENVKTMTIECRAEANEEFLSYFSLSRLEHLKFKRSVEMGFMKSVAKLASDKFQTLTFDIPKHLQMFEKEFDENDGIFPQVRRFNSTFLLKPNDASRIIRYFPALEYISVAIKDKSDIELFIRHLKMLRIAYFQCDRVQGYSPNSIETWLTQNDLIENRHFVYDHFMLKMANI